jgi:molybdenum cofactor cytidylyltransferase
MAQTLQYQFGAIILAAGNSTRMGQPKLLLPWGGTTVLGHLIKSWSHLGAVLVAVVTSSNRLIDAELNRLGFPLGNRIVNSSPEQGMFSSIQCAARWNGWEDGISHRAVVLGDQPHLQPEGTLRKLVEFAGSHPNAICQPSRRGKAKHPVFLPKQIFDELQNSEKRTLKDFLCSAPAQAELLELEDPGLDLDIDCPADYERALQLSFPERDMFKTSRSW